MALPALTPILPGPLGPSDPTGELSAQARSSAAADFDSFLTLLTAQLRNQDPLSPLDSTEFVAQLASFSTVEQLVGTNERLDGLTEQSLSGDIASFAGWIGRDVSVTDGTFRATGAEIAFTVPDLVGAEAIEATVRNAEGQALARFPVTPDTQNQATWDGLDANGLAVSPRDLSIDLTYFQGGSVLATGNAEVMRQVSGIRGTESGILLDLADGGAVAPDKGSRLSAAIGSGAGQ